MNKNETHLEIFKEMLRLTLQNNGLAPTMKKLLKHVSISSTSVANYHYEKLEELQLIKREKAGSKKDRPKMRGGMYIIPESYQQPHTNLGTYDYYIITSDCNSYLGLLEWLKTVPDPVETWNIHGVKLAHTHHTKAELRNMFSHFPNIHPLSFGHEGPIHRQLIQVLDGCNPEKTAVITADFWTALTAVALDIDVYHPGIEFESPAPHYTWTYYPREASDD